MNLTDFRKTKIVATLGPTSVERVKELIIAGVNVFRLNFSHGTQDVHAANIQTIRKYAKELDTNIAILGDLQGPKIRVGMVKEPGILLEVGQEFIISTEECLGEGNRVSTIYTPLSDEVKPGNSILLDDGLLELEVVDVKGKDIYTKVIVGGKLTSRKGINLPNVDIKSPALTTKDVEDLRFILTQDIDYVALSFVRKPEDLDLVHDIMDEVGRRLSVISKIEKPEALVHLDAIIEKSDGLMVARGDLGVEIPAEEVPTEQKRMIAKCNEVGKPVIVATQMLDSMIRNPRPTRAEASDVANAVLDGASAVMLSGETASGDYPIKSVEFMSRIIKNAEDNFFTESGLKRNLLEYNINNDVEGITYSAVNLSDMLKAKLIVCVTDSGSTVKQTARYRPLPPIIAVSDVENPVTKQLALTWGVNVLPVEDLAHTDECFLRIENAIKDLDYLKDGDLVVITAGLPLLKKTTTNMIKVYRVDRNERNMFL
ncbi:MAG: pyruvate kinase [Lentisphaeraceae bacterium]|nr:pyruvate kinase [Lentisphaeraceae bacterium]